MHLNNINTAPKDGTHFIGYGSHCVDGWENIDGLMEVYYDAKYDEWINIANCPSELTQWMPIPEFDRAS